MKRLLEFAAFSEPKKITIKELIIRLKTLTDNTEFAEFREGLDFIMNTKYTANKLHTLLKKSDIGVYFSTPFKDDVSGAWVIDTMYARDNNYITT